MDLMPLALFGQGRTAPFPCCLKSNPENLFETGARLGRRPAAARAAVSEVLENRGRPAENFISKSEKIAREG
jgi:hypothetical protein